MMNQPVIGNFDLKVEMFALRDPHLSFPPELSISHDAHLHFLILESYEHQDSINWDHTTRGKRKAKRSKCCD